METIETKILQGIIEKFVHKNTELILFAQKLSAIIMSYGLIDDATQPFQILPTNFFDSEGDNICKIFVNLDHPIYGFFNIEVEEDKCIITCPKTYHSEVFITNFADCEYWLETLDKEMDTFYQLQSSADQKFHTVCSVQLNEILQSYKKLVEPEIELLKEEISANEKVAIVSGNEIHLVKDAKNDLSRALLIPPLWVIFKDTNDLPDPDEELDDYIDEEATELLIEKLSDFARQESFYAAPIYLAQRILLQSEMNVEGFSTTDNEWVKASFSEEIGELVLPPIDISEFRLS
jgi:hypothetical protein